MYFISLYAPPPPPTTISPCPPSPPAPTPTSLPPDFLTCVKGALCRYFGGGVEVCLQVLRLHTSLSFGITTEKQHSHLHEKSGVSKRRRGGWGGGGGLALRNGPSLMREMGNQRKQTTIAVFADANSLHLCSSCSKSSWV